VTGTKGRCRPVSDKIRSVKTQRRKLPQKAGIQDHILGGGRVKKAASKTKKARAKKTGAKKTKKTAKSTPAKERRLPMDETVKTHKHASPAKEAAPSGSTKPAPRSSEAETGGESIDKVREILFGSQVRDFEKRMSDFENRLQQQVSVLSSDTRKRFDSLESYIKKEMASLIEQLETERDQRNKSLKALSKRLDETDKNLAASEEKSTKAQRELRQQILEQSKTLRDEGRKQHGELSTALDKASKQLRTDKTNRSDLAALLVDMAMRLDQGMGVQLDRKQK